MLAVLSNGRYVEKGGHEDESADLPYAMWATLTLFQKFPFGTSDHDLVAYTEVC